MWSRLGVLVGVAAAIPLAFSANAQGVLMERQISMPMAKAIAEGAVEQCRTDNYHVTATVLDRAGQVRVILRDDGSSPATIDTSRRKAYTARIFRQTTAEFAQRIAANPASAALKEITDVITLAGGIPIKVGDDVIGAVGVSGAPGGDKDEACANAGIQRVADQLR
jgi:uncharacterized protein GlcG (DUF336 family)